MITQMTFYCVLLGILLLSHLILFILVKAQVGSERIKKWFEYALGQFKYNAYIRMFLFCYLDLVFLPAVRISSDDHSTGLRKAFFGIGIVVLIAAVVLPILGMVYMLKNFRRLKEKDFKGRFNALILKIDK